MLDTHLTMLNSRKLLKATLVRNANDLLQVNMPGHISNQMPTSKYHDFSFIFALEYSHSNAFLLKRKQNTDVAGLWTGAEFLGM